MPADSPMVLVPRELLDKAAHALGATVLGPQLHKALSAPPTTSTAEQVGAKAVEQRLFNATVAVAQTAPEGEVIDELCAASAEARQYLDRLSSAAPSPGEGEAPFMYAYECVDDGRWQAYRQQLKRADGSICPGLALYTRPTPATPEGLRLALSRVRDWIRFDLPPGTPAATTMLAVVNAALQPQGRGG